MTPATRRAAALNAVILVATVVLVALVLVVGRKVPEPVDTTLVVGEPAPQTFVANRSTAPIEDVTATEQDREKARLAVPTQYKIDNTATVAARAEVNRFFETLRGGAFAEPPPQPATTTTTTTEPPTTSSSTTTAEASGSTSSTTTTTTEPPTTTTTTIPRKSLDEQVAQLQAAYPILNLETVKAFVTLYNNDLDRVAAGEQAVFPEIEREADTLILQEEERGIRQEDLVDAQNKYLNPVSRPPIFISGLPDDEQALARDAIAKLVASNLRPNMVIDQDAWDRKKEEAAAAVTPRTVVYRAGDTIVNEGEPLTAIQIQAIDQLGLFKPDVKITPLPAMALLGAIVVLLAAFFLWRIAPGQWSRPRHFALLGIILLLAAVVSRIPEFFLRGDPELGYVMPAVAIGFIAAILFDPRTAVLLAIPTAGFTAISLASATVGAGAEPRTVAFTVFAAVATVVPVGFVSSVSSRRQLRLAVMGSAVAMLPVAFALEWLFGEYRLAVLAGAWASIGALVAGFLGQGLVSFLENAFGITTTLNLLDLLDRNHPALRLLEEQAPGTFNHSMLVGSLAGRAARAIGADPLLAQAAAWYHDLGKTENPQYFIENQVGVSNPHDLLPPAESAQIIRRHVTDGLRLARRYRIPPEVAEGIREHHGTGLMRYFYHKALDEDPAVDADLFRHHGVRPRRKEMAILMLADAAEGATRAYAQHEDPTAEGLMDVVDAVVQEKLDDRQLDESQLTFGDLTRIKEELVRAFIGYYHTRVPYPGFPGPTVPQGRAAALPAGEDSPDGPATEDAGEEGDDDV